MLNALTPWLLNWQLPLMPPAPASPAAPVPDCRWLGATLSRAGVGALLQAPEGVTLLAPTDAALEAAALQPAHMAPEALQRWLLRHLTLASPRQVGVLPLLDGGLLRRAEYGPGWVDASGARVHLVGRPLLQQTLRVQPIDRPLEGGQQTVWQRVSADPALAPLAHALARCGLDGLLGCGGPFTLFAPTGTGLDRAAARLGLGRAALWQDTDALRALLLHHIVPGRWASSALPWGARLRTLAGCELGLDVLGLLHSGDLGLPLAPGSDQPCRNGVLHRVPEALLPA